MVACAGGQRRSARTDAEDDLVARGRRRRRWPHAADGVQHRRRVAVAGWRRALGNHLLHAAAGVRRVFRLEVGRISQEDRRLGQLISSLAARAKCAVNFLKTSAFPIRCFRILTAEQVRHSKTAVAPRNVNYSGRSCSSAHAD